MRVTQIKTHRMPVDFKRGVVFVRRGVELVHRKIEAWTTIHEATSWVTDHMHKRMTNCFEDALGGEFWILLERGVRACDDPIKLREKFIAVIERAITQDVDFTSCPDLHLWKSRACGVNCSDMREESRVIKTVRLELALAVIGNCDGVKATTLRVGDELVDAERAVAGGGVRVEFGFDVFDSDDAWMFRCEFKRIELATIFTHRRRHPRKTKRGIDVMLLTTRNIGRVLRNLAFACGLKQTVLIQTKALRNRAFAQSHIVFFAACEVLQRRAEAFNWHYAQVNLHAVMREHRSLRVASREHLCDFAAGAENFHQTRHICRARKNVEVANRFLSATKTSCKRHALHERQGAEFSH